METFWKFQRDQSVFIKEIHQNLSDLLDLFNSDMHRDGSESSMGKFFCSAGNKLLLIVSAITLTGGADFTGRLVPKI